MGSTECVSVHLPLLDLPTSTRLLMADIPVSSYFVRMELALAPTPIPSPDAFYSHSLVTTAVCAGAKDYY